MYKKNIKLMVLLLVITFMFSTHLTACSSVSNVEGLQSLDELAQHSDILHFQEHKADSNQLFETELWCVDLRAYYHEHAQYPNVATRPRLYADEVLWYNIRYQSGEEQIGGYICAPKDYLEKDYPVLIYNHGGWGAGALRSEDVQYFTRYGFIVLASAYRGGGLGSTGKDGYGGEDVNDVIKLMDLAEEFTFTNGKMYMFGWSRGGMETYNVLSRDDRIDAAVAGAGPTDLTKFYDEFVVNRREARFHGYIGGSPETHPEEYEARSAVCWPDKINTPLWIAHGTADDTVLVHHSEELYKAMNALGKDVKLTLFPDMDHDTPFPYWGMLPDYFYWLKQH